MRKAQEGGFVWKDGGDTGTSLEFLVDALNGVGSAQKLLHNGGGFAGGAPCTSISARASVSACSLRVPLAKAEG